MKRLLLILSALPLLFACTQNTQQQTPELTADKALQAGSPWATTAIYLQEDGQADKTTNLIDDPSLSAGTISSAQYRDGMFMFVSMSDYHSGTFDENTLIGSLNAVAAEIGTASGFSYGDYEILSDGIGNRIRRLSNPSFNPALTIDRTLSVATASEFTYTFVKDGNTYYVEHKPYQQAFPAQNFPQALQTAVDALFNAKLSTEKMIDYRMKTGSPWVTTAIYPDVNGTPDTRINLIDDNNISAGTISSAQYHAGKFVFLGMQDYRTGALDEATLIGSLNEVTANTTSPQGFSVGDYAILKDGANSLRRITNASFAPTATIDRRVITATDSEFTYSFVKDGNTYYVEHQPYALAFPELTYPAPLQDAVDRLLWAR